MFIFKVNYKKPMAVVKRLLGAHRKYLDKMFATGKPTRTYAGDFVFENDTLSMINFAGGYFDSKGRPCYRHTDWQGNVTMVTDHNGQLAQHTGYYPYGEPWREPAGQPYLFGAKERLRDNALNEYDFSARRYYSALGIWSTPDPKAAEFAAANPYSYCSGNPIRFIDPSGCDIFVLNIGRNGDLHLAMLIQNDEGKWQYYSVNGNNVYSSGKHTGGRKYNDVGVGCWDSPQEFLDSSYNTKGNSDEEKDDPAINNYGFEEGFQISSSKKQDAEMREEFEKIAESEYNLVTNNCAHAVEKTLIKGGIPISEEKIGIVTSSKDPYSFTPTTRLAVLKNDISIIPPLAFKSIMKANPNGVYLKRTKK